MKRVPLRNQTKLYQRIRRERLAALLAGGFIRTEEDVPADAIPAAMNLQARHNTYAPKTFYADRRFRCVDCGKSEVWTAEQQMHWHESLKGTIYALPKRCRSCRRVDAQQKVAHRDRSLAGAKRKSAARATRPKTP